MMFGGGVTQDDHFSDTWRFDMGEFKQAHGWSLIVPVQTPTTTPPQTAKTKQKRERRNPPGRGHSTPPGASVDAPQRLRGAQQ